MNGNLENFVEMINDSVYLTDVAQRDNKFVFVVTADNLSKIEKSFAEYYSIAACANITNVNIEFKFIGVKFFNPDVKYLLKLAQYVPVHLEKFVLNNGIMFKRNIQSMIQTGNILFDLNFDGRY